MAQVRLSATLGSRALQVFAMWSALLLLPLGATFSYQAPLLEERQQTIAFSAPSTVPSSASDVVGKDYPALAMSAHSFQEYAGNASTPNTFSANLISNIGSRTGAPVHIRVGGTSGDFSVYDPNQKAAFALPPGSAPGSIPRGITMGPAYFEGFANFPGVKWTYMAHLANDMETNSIQATQEALKYIGSNLDALEIGNEIDLYPKDARPASYSVADYISEWQQFWQGITKAVGNKNFQAPVYANNNPPWNIANAFTSGQAAKGSITSAAVHHYMDDTDVPVSSVQANYMNHTRIVDQLNPLKMPIAWLKQNRPGTGLHFGEVNSNTYSTGNYDVLGTFGNTLWLVDFMLYSAAIGFERINVQQSTGFSYTSWRGEAYNGLPAAVLPPYYAHPFVADVLGNAGDVRISDLSLGLDTFSAYGIYDNASGKLTKIVLINLERYDSTSGESRTYQMPRVNVGNNYASNFTMEYLTAPGAEVQDASKISWKGESYTFASNGKPVVGQSTTTTSHGWNGMIWVPVYQSQAVLVTL
ncbi:Hypothetical predicted protein [Lecanosticta acicola]|uniref:Beta-glucuronidase C-terminal domain-containing protein n=1 Tax=Lecanosticta acicola TaxID=111012 RepID=A0AAI8W0Z3_9PEZI|nr:Hypothetical predicted protein [Lecanosticta acicola]